jgi:hypothetical protein
MRWSTSTGINRYTKLTVLPYSHFLTKIILLPCPALVCSGRLILALADLKYDKRRMTTVEIVYNVISAVVAVLIGVGFTVYARRALDGIQSAEGARQPEPAAIPTGPASELLGSHRSSSSRPVDVV